jgi:hypothetical protein
MFEMKSIQGFHFEALEVDQSELILVLMGSGACMSDRPKIGGLFFAIVLICGSFSLKDGLVSSEKRQVLVSTQKTVLLILDIAYIQRRSLSVSKDCVT